MEKEQKLNQMSNFVNDIVQFGNLKYTLHKTNEEKQKMAELMKKYEKFNLF